MLEEDDVIVITKVEEPPPPDAGLPPWMATFADMVTLLLCFFVLLLSFANTDTQEMKDMLGNMKQAFGVQYENSSYSNIAYSTDARKFKQTQKEQEQLKELVLELQKFVSAFSESDVSISRESSGVMLRAGSSHMFEPGKADLLPETIPLLQEIVKILSMTRFTLMVCGHTDGEAQAQRKNIDSNWELSTVRAAACLRWILDHSHIKADRLKAVGYAGSRPLVPSITERNKAKNRRVEFYFVPAGDPDW